MCALEAHLTGGKQSMVNCVCSLRCQARRDVYKDVLALGNQVIGPDLPLEEVKIQNPAGTKRKKRWIVLDSST